MDSRKFVSSKQSDYMSEKHGNVRESEIWKELTKHQEALGKILSTKTVYC